MDILIVRLKGLVRTHTSLGVLSVHYHDYYVLMSAMHVAIRGPMTPYTPGIHPP